MNKQQIHTLIAYSIAVCACVVSLYAWTSMVSAKQIEIEDIAFASTKSAELHQAAGEFDYWELEKKWELRIPALGVVSPVVLPSTTYWDSAEWKFLEEQMQVGMTEGVVAYPHSVYPGEYGALIVAGHSSPPSLRAKESDYGHVFSRLPEITEGELIEIETSQGIVRYTVEYTTIVSPEQTTVLKQNTHESELRLITCYPVGTTKERLVVVAKLQENR